MSDQGIGPVPEDNCAHTVDAAPYVLGALTEQENVAFVAHLQTCAICREEVAALEVVASVLPAAASQVLAPHELKDRVMVTVRQEASLNAPDASPGSARARGSSFGWLQWRPALAGAVVAGAVALVAVLVGSGGGGGAAHARVVHGQVTAATGTATIHISEGHAELDVADMPQTTPGRVYELWLKRSGAPQPTNVLFTVSTNGDATVGVPGSISGVSEILVTSEPRGGSRVPTRNPVIVAPLS
jgi:anti-sigma-K factor RskA